MMICKWCTAYLLATGLWPFHTPLSLQSHTSLHITHHYSADLLDCVVIFLLIIAASRHNNHLQTLLQVCNWDMLTHPPYSGPISVWLNFVCSVEGINTETMVWNCRRHQQGCHRVTMPLKLRQLQCCDWHASPMETAMTLMVISWHKTNTSTLWHVFIG